MGGHKPYHALPYHIMGGLWGGCVWVEGGGRGWEGGITRKSSSSHHPFAPQILDTVENKQNTKN